MRYSAIIVAAAISAVSAQQEDCQATYKSCIAAGTPEVVCSCNLTTCSGEDAARIRDYCATATAGLVAASSTTASASIVTGTIVQPSGAPQITAPAGSLALGAACGADEQCGAGVQCFGSTAGTIRTCGNFNAACSADSQCAFNTCNNGLCNGFLPSSAYPANTVSKSATTAAPTTTGGSSFGGPIQCNPARSSCTEISGTLVPVPTTASAAMTTTYACNPAHQYPTGQVCTEIGGSLTLITTTGTAAYVPHPTAGSNGTTAATTTGARASTTSITPYTGAASNVGATLSGFAAVIAGVAAWIL